MNFIITLNPLITQAFQATSKIIISLGIHHAIRKVAD